MGLKFPEKFFLVYAVEKIIFCNVMFALEDLVHILILPFIFTSKMEANSFAELKLTFCLCG